MGRHVRLLSILVSLWGALAAVVGVSMLLLGFVNLLVFPFGTGLGA